MKRGAWLIPAVLLLASATYIATWTPRPVAEDPLVRMPGTQPQQLALEAPNRCFNCHGDYNPAVEPGSNWAGSMMAQASRDFLFWSCMTVAAQDSIWAVGTPNAVDICERCHFPQGWLEGRSDPPNASAMTGSDYDGVHCDLCHRMYDPFAKATYAGTREGSAWQGYWDETNSSDTPSKAAASETYQADLAQQGGVSLFNGAPFFVDNEPFSSLYTENASGQFFVSVTSDKRASFADAQARHRMLYSRYHKSKFFCGTCHDVSNPVLANLNADPQLPLPTEVQPAHSYFHVERTFSEFMLSAYGAPGGAPGIGPFAPGTFATSLPNDSIARCQDCHMRDSRGAGCDKKGAPIRTGDPDTTDSAEHPFSGLPIHDLTGGNLWVPRVLASTVPGAANYDSTNEGLLNQGPAVLTLDPGQGEGIDPAALLAGAERARQQLELAASIQGLAYNASNGILSFRLQNQTGHRLISGFPEGRRMFVNIKAWSGTTLIREINPYDPAAHTLKGLSHTYRDPAGQLPPPQPLASHEVHVDHLVYEMHPTSTLTGEQETFHFALATGRYKDNRIPPKGFRIASAVARQCEPVWHGVSAPDYFTAEEYAGGYDHVTLTIPTGADRVEVELYYQTTSREYIEFLRDEINGNADTLKGTGAGGDQPYVVQTDPFFAKLAAWGDTIWQLWKHNRAVPGAAPVRMAAATWGGGGGCQAPTPTLISAVPGNGQATLTWSDEHTADPSVGGYKLYYDQAGKALLVADMGLATTYTDTGLSNGLPYCYKVTSYHDATCESGFSNILCATPNAGGQLVVGVASLETGRWEKSGKGKNQTTVFVVTSAFPAGDAVTVRAHVNDNATGLPLANAAVSLRITGPESVDLTTDLSDSEGIAEATWQTKAPGKRNQPGTPPGAYTVTVSGVTASGYSWDRSERQAGFTIQ